MPMHFHHVGSYLNSITEFFINTQYLSCMHLPWGLFHKLQYHSILKKKPHILYEMTGQQ